MPGQTIHLHRVLRTTPEKLYRAFLEADALASLEQLAKLVEPDIPNG